MKTLFAIAALCFPVLAFAQVSTLQSGSLVYIEPMGGYETYLAAAFTKKHVPLIVVADKDKANFIIRSAVNQSAPSQPAVVVNNSVNNVNNGSGNTQSAGTRGGFPGGGYPSPGSYGHTSASISVVEMQSSRIVFADAAGKLGANQLQRTAEDCANHLKSFIEKSEKLKK